MEKRATGSQGLANCEAPKLTNWSFMSRHKT